MLSCGDNKDIETLLRSEDTNDLVEGAFMAGESGNKKFTPLLLKNANDPRISHHLRFKGLSVYQQKMEALRKIYKQAPPVEISWTPDSLVIRYYTKLAQKKIAD